MDVTHAKQVGHISLCRDLNSSTSPLSAKCVPRVYPDNCQQEIIMLPSYSLNTLKYLPITYIAEIPVNFIMLNYIIKLLFFSIGGTVKVYLRDELDIHTM